MSAEQERPVVDPCDNQNPPLAPGEAHERFNFIQRKMRNSFGTLCFTLVALTIGVMPVVGIPPFLVLSAWLGAHWAIRRFFDMCTGNWMCVMCFFYEKVLGIKIRTFGFKGRFKKRSVIIMNHVSHLDWLFFWSVVDRYGDFSFWKVIMKEKPLRQLPILGWCMQFSNFLFIKRRWEEDEKEFHDKLHYLNGINYPCQLLLFPEGGDMTHKTRKRSDKYADENSLPCYQYCIHPRTTGFVYVMNALRSGGLDAVYDVTIGYPDVLPKTEIEVAKGIMPREVHFHIKSYDDRDLPRDDEQLRQWCKDRWREKEERLKHFYTHKEFRDTQVEDHTKATYLNGLVHHRNGLVNGHSKVDTKAKEALLGKNYLYFLYSVFIFTSTNYLIYVVAWIPYGVLYLTLAFLVQLLVSVYGGGLDKVMLHFKRREIEEAFSKMKAMKEGKVHVNGFAGHSKN